MLFPFDFWYVILDQYIVVLFNCNFNFKNTDYSTYIPDIPGYISDVITDIPCFLTGRKLSIIAAFVS